MRTVLTASGKRPGMDSSCLTWGQTMHILSVRKDGDSQLDAVGPMEHRALEVVGAFCCGTRVVGHDVGLWEHFLAAVGTPMAAGLK